MAVAISLSDEVCRMRFSNDSRSRDVKFYLARSLQLPLIGQYATAAGDLLLACSDGILESFNEADQEFGITAPRPLTDDMTLVIVRNNES